MVATRGIMDYLFMAVCEWFLMFWLFIEAALAYSLTRFAKYCQLQIPCLLCSRIDHFFGKEEPYLHLFCKKHQTYFSYLMYCNVHNELVDVREMCQDCSNSAALQTQSNYRFGQSSILNKNFVCECCKSQWKEKPMSQQPIWSNVVGSRGSKVTTKPPLPRVARHGRSKRLKNKAKHRHRNASSPVEQYSGVKFTSDSEFEFIFSDNDDGGFKVVGISERSLKNDTNGVNPYRILGTHSHSTPDLRSAFLLEAQLNEARARARTRSASLTPNCLIRCSLAELNRKTEEFDPLRIGKDKNRLSSINHRTHGSMDGSMFSRSNNGSQNRYKIFSRHSFSAADLGSAIRLEMHNNNNLRQRSASLTPNFSSGYGLGERQLLKNVPPKVMKHKRFSQGNVRSGASTTYLDRTNGYGYSDDSAVSRNTGNHHNRYRIPRRHSYSVFQLGGQILLNMPTDESQNGFEEYKKSKSRSQEPDFLNMMQFPRKDDQDYIPLPTYNFLRGDLPIPFIDRSKGYGSLDDSVVIRNAHNQYQNTAPRRHSHSFFDLGREILLNMPTNESLTSSSASFALGGSLGYGFEQPNSFEFQTRPNPSAEFVQIPHRKNKRSKKSSSSLHRTSGYESLDDSAVSFNRGIHDRSRDPRRHSYSAFELGCALLNAQPIDRSLTNSSASVARTGAINHGFREPKRPGFQMRHNSSIPPMLLNKNQRHGFLDDSVVSFNTGIYDRNNDPRRHSYSAFELGCALLNAQPIDRSLTNSSACVARTGAINHGFREPKRPGFQMRHNSSHPPMLLNKNQRHGFLDDSVVSFNTGSYDRNGDRRRHSYSAFELGCALLNAQPIDRSLTNSSASVTRNAAINHGFGKPKRPVFQTRHISSHPTMFLNKNQGYGFLDDSVVSFITGINDRNNDPRRHSYSAFELGCALLENAQPIDKSLINSTASVTRNGFGEPKRPVFLTKHISSHPTMFLNKNQGYGFLDDSVVSFITGIYDKNNDPRRHSYSAFELGGALLQNAQPVNKSLTNSSASVTRNGAMNHVFVEPKRPVFQTRNISSHPTMFLNKNQGYGFLDDSVVSFNTGIYDRNNDPRRHSYSAFDLGCALLNSQPFEKGLTNSYASVTQNGAMNHGFGEPNMLGFQTRDNFSDATMFLNKSQGYRFLDDSAVSFNRGVHDRNKDPRRHSYSAFELGCALLLNAQPIDKSLTNSSAYMTQNGAINHGFGEPNRPRFQTSHNSSHSVKFLKKNQGYGFLDDSVVTHNTGIDNHNHHHNQSKLPRRHSYSILQLGGDILLNMPTEESLTRHSMGQSSGAPQNLKIQKLEKKWLPPTGYDKQFSSPYDVRSDLSIDRTKWHGSFDDYLISRSARSQSQSNIPRRHSHSAFDLGRALLLEINLDNSLKNFHASLQPNGSTVHGTEEHNRAHHKAKRHKNHLPPPCPTIPLGSSSDFRNDMFTVSLDKTHGVRSLDDSFYSHKRGNHNQNSDSNPRRHSYSAFELGCALLLNMQRDASLTRRSASLTPKIQTVKEGQHLIFKKDEQPVASVNTIRSELFKPHGHQFFDDSVVSNGKDGRKRCKNLKRNYYSVSDLTSPVMLQMNLDEGLTRKSASLTPDCIIGQGFGDMNSLKFQSGSTSSHQKRKKRDRSKAKRGKRSKAKRSKKPLRTTNNVKITSSSANAASDLSYESFEDSDTYESFDDSDTYGSTTDSQNRYRIFSRNSQSASDLGSVVFLEMHTDRSRNRSKSLTPNRSYFHDSIDPVQLFAKKHEQKHPTELEKYKKHLHNHPTKEMDSSSTTTRADLCPTCLDKIDLRSLDGSITSEIDYDGVEKVKKQAEDDVRCMRLLQSELEAERNAATVAANHAMNMITRLQQEKAALQMEALQYLRMMEEQAEYDMEALQKANELVEEKENEIQDLLNELEQYRNKYGDEPMNNIKTFDDEKRYILESLSTLEKKINQLSNGVHDKTPESEKYVDFAKLEHEVLDMKMKIEALQTDLDFVKHVCNTLQGNEGLEFVQNIAHQLQDLRRIMFDRRLISSN